MVPWKPPGALDGISIHQINQALDAIDRGIVDDGGAPTGHFYTATAAGARNDRWAGHVLKRHFGCEDVAAKKLIKDWLERGVLEVTEYLDKRTRRALKGVVAPQKNRPGNEEVFK